jgi:hypothetical protein
MAKAKYHKSQRVFVKPVGTWAYVEAVVPKWIKGCEEPIKITYDCGMGREFAQEELEEESAALQTTAVNGLGGAWRVVRGHNRWKSAEQCGHHPHPGTHPMVVTTERDWGGWHVPGAEYDLDPNRVERQAMKLLEEFVEYADQEPENLSEDLTKLAQIARRIISEVSQ